MSTVQMSEPDPGGYDLSPDGDRFVMIKAGDATGDVDQQPQIILVQNWLEELKRLVPVD